MDVITLKEKLSLIDELWSPKEIAKVDDMVVKLVKIKDAFVWHSHDNEDELFLVLEGRFRMDFRDEQRWVETGEMVVVPKTVEHKPFAEEECSILLFESTRVINTGIADDPRRIEVVERI